MTDAIVTMNQTLYGKPQVTVTAWTNVLEDSAWLQEFADAIRASANDQWDNNMVNNWSLENISVSFIDVDHIAYSVTVDFTQGNLVGNIVTDGMPASACLLIRTGFVGPRPNRGRMYFAGFGETSQSDGVWDGPSTQNMRELVELWRDGLGGTGGDAFLAIARRPSDVFPEYVLNPVQTVGSTGRTRSQRRRNTN